MDECIHRLYDVISGAGSQLAQGLGIQALQVVQQLVAVVALKMTKGHL